MSNDPKWARDMDVARGRAVEHVDVATAWLKFLVWRLPPKQQSVVTKALIKLEPPSMTDTSSFDE